VHGYKHSRKGRHGMILGIQEIPQHHQAPRNRKKPEDTRLKITEAVPESNVSQGSMYSIVYDSLRFTQGLCNMHTQAINR